MSQIFLLALYIYHLYLARILTIDLELKGMSSLPLLSMLLLVVIQWVELELKQLLRYCCSCSGNYQDLHDDLPYVTQRDVVGYGSLYLAQFMELEGTMGLLGSLLPFMCALHMAPDPGL